MKKNKKANGPAKPEKDLAAALDAATSGVNILADGCEIAQDQESLSRLHSWAKDLLSRLPAEAACPSELPENAVRMENWPQNLPEIENREIGAFLTARTFFQVARANYERRRGELLYKLLLGCEMEDRSASASYVVSLESDGNTICILDQGTRPSERIIDRR